MSTFEYVFRYREQKRNNSRGSLRKRQPVGWFVRQAGAYKWIQSDIHIGMGANNSIRTCNFPLRNSYLTDFMFQIYFNLSSKMSRGMKRTLPTALHIFSSSASLTWFNLRIAAEPLNLRCWFCICHDAGQCQILVFAHLHLCIVCVSLNFD